MVKELLWEVRLEVCFQLRESLSAIPVLSHRLGNIFLVLREEVTCASCGFGKCQWSPVEDDQRFAI